MGRLDLPVMAGCARVLAEYEIPNRCGCCRPTARQLPLHFAREAAAQGLQIVAGAAAHLAGVSTPRCR